MALERMKQLAADFVYEPNRGLVDDGPEPIRGKAFEVPARLDGNRVFLATDQDGNVCGVGIMEPGGDKKRLAAPLYMRIELSGEVPILKAV